MKNNPFNKDWWGRNVCSILLTIHLEVLVYNNSDLEWDNGSNALCLSNTYVNSKHYIPGKCFVSDFIWVGFNSPLLSPLLFNWNFVQDYWENIVITQLCKTAGAINKITSASKETRVNFIKIENVISCICMLLLFKIKKLRLKNDMKDSKKTL